MGLNISEASDGASAAATKKPQFSHTVFASRKWKELLNDLYINPTKYHGGQFQFSCSVMSDSL